MQCYAVLCDAVQCYAMLCDASAESEGSDVIAGDEKNLKLTP
jgi:hypothetical protein